MTNKHDAIGALVTTIGFLLLTATFITAPWAPTESIIICGVIGGIACVAGCLVCLAQPDQDHSHTTMSRSSDHGSLDQSTVGLTDRTTDSGELSEDSV